MKYEHKRIRNLDGTLGFMIHIGPDGTKTVRNKHGELLGRIINGQTRDKSGNLLSWDENLGLLMKEDR